MKIAVSSYSFSQAMADGRMTMLDVLPKAKELGYDGVEIVRDSRSHEDMLSLAEQLRAQSEKMNMPIIAYMVGNDFLANDVDVCVSRLSQELEVARALGAPMMRHDATAGYLADGTKADFEAVLPRLAEGYRRVTEIAQQAGIRTMIENHGYFAQDASRVKALVQAVDHENFGWLCDMGNFMCADEICVESVSVAAPIAIHAHAKDFHHKLKGEYIPKHGWFPTRNGNMLRGAIIGHGVVNVPECLRILRDAGYTGWLSTEFEGIEDCLFALKEDIDALRDMTDALGM